MNSNNESDNSMINEYSNTVKSEIDVLKDRIVNLEEYIKIHARCVADRYDPNTQYNVNIADQNRPGDCSVM